MRVGVIVGMLMSIVSGVALVAQAPQRQQAPGSRIPTARQMASVDVTGYWVTAVTEDWRLRMITPQKGDYQNVPLNSAGVKVLRAWDPAADRAQGNDCKPYGAAAIMRMPTRIHVTWQDENTLKLDFDHGQQTRLVYFNSSRPARVERSLQGYAVGEWIDFLGRPVSTIGERQAAPAQMGLRIVSTNLQAQYVRRNGAPVSENAIVTDMLEVVPGPQRVDWMVVKTIVHDPTYFTDDLIVSSHFKREPDAAKWSPRPCEVELPPLTRPLREPPPR